MSVTDVISPRGIPPIRPDWLVDAAWRLADVGLDVLRSVPDGTSHVLEDVVDGGTWRFESQRLTPPWTTSVEHDADLFLPTDTGPATLRAGFQFTPWWDEEQGGACVQVRVEIGPRGPVTFDPENWIVVIPRPRAGASARPGAAGVQAGTWQLDQAAQLLEHGTVGDLFDKALSFRDLPLVTTDRPVSELLLDAAELVPRKRLLGRERLVPADPPGTLVRIEAEGPIEASWTGEHSLGAITPRGFHQVTSVDVPVGHCTFRGAEGALTLTGPGLVLSVHGR